MPAVPERAPEPEHTAARSTGLLGTSAIVTGASSGIGREISRELAGAGASLLAVARDDQRLNALTQELGALNIALEVVRGDVADPMTAEIAVRAAIARFGRIDVLVNAAGTNVDRRMLRHISVEDWRRVIDTNLNGAFYFMRTALPALRERGGSIVNIVSWAAHYPAYWAGAAYIASKVGLLALTRQINAEERIHGIRACAILPGEVDTPILDARPVPPPSEERAAMLRPKDIAAIVLNVVTQPSHVNIEELAVRPQRVRNLAAQFQRLVESDDGGGG